MSSFKSKSELNALSEKELKQATKEIMKVRKMARSLTAGFRMVDADGFEKKIEGMLGFFYNLPEDVVNAKIMEVFVGAKKYEDIRELNDKKFEYDHLPTYQKKVTPDPRTARDYFDVPTQYHFFKYLQMLGLSFNEMQKETGVRKFFYGKPEKFARTNENLNNNKYNLRHIDDFLQFARDRYATMDKTDNMCFSEWDIKVNLNTPPIKTFRSLASLEEARALDRARGIEVPECSVSREFESQVFDYMLQYVAVEKGINLYDCNLIRMKKSGENYLGFRTDAPVRKQSALERYEALSNEIKERKEAEAEEQNDGQMTLVEYIQRVKEENELSKRKAEAEAEENESVAEILDQEKEECGDFDAIKRRTISKNDNATYLRGSFECAVCESGIPEYREGELTIIEDDEDCPSII